MADGLSNLQVVEPAISDPGDERMASSSQFSPVSISNMRTDSAENNASSPISSIPIVSSIKSVMEDKKDEAHSALLFPPSAHFLRRISIFLDGMDEFGVGRVDVVKALFVDTMKDWQEGAVNNLSPEELTRKLQDDLHMICVILERGPKWQLNSFLAAMDELRELHSQLSTNAGFCEPLEKESFIEDILRLQSFARSKLITYYHNEVRLCGAFPPRHILLAISKSDLTHVDSRPALLHLPPLSSPRPSSTSSPSTPSPHPFPSAYSRILNKPSPRGVGVGLSRVQVAEHVNLDERDKGVEALSSQFAAASVSDLHSDSGDMNAPGHTSSIPSSKHSQSVTEDMKDEVLSAWLFPPSARFLRRISTFLEEMNLRDEFSVGRADVVKALFFDIVKDWQEGTVGSLSPEELTQKLKDDLHMIMTLTLGERILCEKITKDAAAHFPTLVSLSRMDNTLSFLFAMTDTVVQRVESLPCPQRIYCLLDLFGIMDVIDPEVMKALFGAEEEEGCTKCEEGEERGLPFINDFGNLSISDFIMTLRRAVQEAFLAYGRKLEDPPLAIATPANPSTKLGGRTNPMLQVNMSQRAMSIGGGQLPPGGIHSTAIDIVNSICTFYDRTNYHGAALFKLMGETASVKKLQPWVIPLLQALAMLLNRESRSLNETEQHLFMMNNVHYVCKTLALHEATKDYDFSDWIYYRSEGFYLSQFAEKSTEKFPQLGACSSATTQKRTLWSSAPKESPMIRFNVAVQELVFNKNWLIPDSDLRKRAQRLVTKKIIDVYSILASDLRSEQGPDATLPYTPDSIERIMKHLFAP